MKKICVIIAMFALVFQVSACVASSAPSAGPDPNMFFEALEAGKYYIQFSLAGQESGMFTEIAVDGENVEFLQHLYNYNDRFEDNGKILHTLLLGNTYYNFSDESNIVRFRDCTENERQGLFNNHTVSYLLPFGSHPCGNGTAIFESADSPDNTEYYYEEYYATVGELRDKWIFSSQTPDDAVMFFRLYFSGHELYAYSLKAESEEWGNPEFRIYEFLSGPPDRFTFALPDKAADLEKVELGEI